MSRWKTASHRCENCSAELLLEANEPAQALREFEMSLRNNPNRYRSFAISTAKSDDLAAPRSGEAPLAWSRLVSVPP
jgi:hypothetical protein